MIHLIKEVCQTCKEERRGTNSIKTFEEHWDKGLVFCPKSTFAESNEHGQYSYLESRRSNIHRTKTYPVWCPHKEAHSRFDLYETPLVKRNVTIDTEITCHKKATE